MARLWVAYREGLRLLGHVVADLSLEDARTKLDVAPWRIFTTSPPDVVDAERVSHARGRKRILVEVAEADRGELSAFAAGLYDSPFSPAEALRRVGS